MMLSVLYISNMDSECEKKSAWRIVLMIISYTMVQIKQQNIILVYRMNHKI